MILGLRLLAVALVSAAAFAAEGADAPAARVRGEMIVITPPADLLADRTIRRQLTSGLTTTFLLVGQEGNRRGAARIEIRYEPWDEMYFVWARGIDAVLHSARFPTFERLAEWWRTAAVPLIRAPMTRATITLEVLPFSIEEQKETQRWLARSLGEAHRQQGIDPGEVRGTAGAASVLDALIGTSIQRQPILLRRWTIPVTR